MAFGMTSVSFNSAFLFSFVILPRLAFWLSNVNAGYICLNYPVFAFPGSTATFGAQMFRDQLVICPCVAWNKETLRISSLRGSNL